MSVVILYGTETGNGELVADAIADVLAAEHDPSIYDMSEYAVEDLDPEDFLVIVCSTYGEGKLPTGAEPFAEDGWGTLRIGEVRFRTAEVCDRCVMTTIDPETIVAGKEPIRTLARHRAWDGKTWFGTRLVPLDEGRIAIGDEVVPGG